MLITATADEQKLLSFNIGILEVNESHLLQLHSVQTLAFQPKWCIYVFFQVYCAVSEREYPGQY